MEAIGEVSMLVGDVLGINVGILTIRVVTLGSDTEMLETTPDLVVHRNQDPLELRF